MGRERRFARAALALALLQGGPSLAEPLPHPDCTPGPPRTETLAGIGPRGEVRFASGGRAVLDSLVWPEEDGAARGWIAGQIGRKAVVIPRGSPDRWDRSRADIQIDEDGTDLAGGLIEAGLAYADPGEAEALCRPALRLVEAAARRRRLGLWRDDRPSAEDGPALRRLVGHYAVVEGRVRHVGERSTRTYLDFVPRGADGLTVTVTKRTWRTMVAHGLTADSLRDRRVRVRGFIELWRSPVLVAATPDAIEVLDGEAPGVQDAAGQDDSGARR